MNLQEPDALWLLLLIPVGAVGMLLLRRRRMRSAVRYTNVEILGRVAGRAPRWRTVAPALLFALAVVLLVAGLARPQGSTRIAIHRGTVILAIDNSLSMYANDIQPTRMAAAKAAAIEFVRNLSPQFRVGLVTFSNTAEVRAQPTTDHAAVIAALERLKPDAGTALGEALAESVKLYEQQQSSGLDATQEGGGVLLLADGENSAGDVSPPDATALAANDQIPVYTVSLGTAEGTIIVRGQSFKVPSHPSTLQAIASATGGEFFDAPTESDLLDVYRGMSSRFVAYAERTTGEITWVFGLLAIPLVALAIGLSLAFKGRFP